MLNRSSITWDEYFMGVASLSALRSKDPSTKVGACIVNKKKRIVGIGYNGLPYGCSDDVFPWGRVGENIDTKYPYVVHAEANAILNANTPLDDCTIYVTLFPCNECTKLIIQSGIKEIVYADDKYFGTDSSVSARRMLEAANIKLRRMHYVGVKVVKGDIDD